ncbi:MAG: NnrS family protein [Akkermansiaceae bacterium]|nr:NnrS family protein [Akkermansiaceae bacterium]
MRDSLYAASEMMSKTSRALRMAATEPYRIFFPVALLASVTGVMLWPLFYWGQLSYYPLFSHARLMIEGFVGGFAIGFLTTALPKMLNAKPLRVWQMLLILVLFISFCTAHALGHLRTGDGLFTVTMALTVALMLVRLVKGNAVPPPGMALAGLGLLCGIAGAAWSAVFGFTADMHWTQFMQRLLYQAFILFPLLGVGGFIFPMILGTTNRHARLGNPQMRKEWRAKAAESALLGVILIFTYWVEVHGGVKMMSWVRVALCGVWITKESGWLLRKKAKGIMPLSLRAGIVCLLGGMVATGILEQNKIALDHMLYIGGFGLITMMVATRVIYGHSGQGDKFQKWVKPVIWCVGLLLFGMATRVSADFMVHINSTLRVSHHIYAAACWVVVSIIWGIAVMPSVRKAPFPTFVKPTPKPTDKPSLMDMDFRKK